MRRFRLLLPIVLLFLAGAAHADPRGPDDTSAPPTPSSGESSGPRGDPEEDTSRRSPREVKSAPARNTGQRPATPRWHSFLPGMFR